MKLIERNTHDMFKLDQQVGVQTAKRRRKRNKTGHTLPGF